MNPGISGVRPPPSGAGTDFDQSRIQAKYQQGLFYHRAGDYSTAAKIYSEILSRFPNHAGSLHFLGMIYFANGELEESLRLVERSLRICDHKSLYFNNYGAILNASGRHHEASQAFERAVVLRSDNADAWSNSAMIYQRLHEPVRKVKSALQRVLQIQPEHHHALTKLANIYTRDRQYPEAMELWKRHVLRGSPSANDYHRLGSLCGECGLIQESQQYFQKSSEMRGGKKIWRWKHLWYSPTVFDTEEEIISYRKKLNADLDSALTERTIFDWKTLFSDGFTHSFNLPHQNSCDRQELEKYTQFFTSSFPFDRPNYRPGKRIRVGFLITPGHENGFIRMTTGVMTGLNPDRFEVVLIHHESSTLRLKSVSERSGITTVSYSWDPEISVRKIRDLHCDVIYYWKAAADLWSFFLPMCRLAPIQCTSWATHGTSGMHQIDWYLSWNRAEISSADSHYTERLYLMDTSPLYEPVPSDLPAPATRKELYLPETGALYFCPHRVQKYHPIMDSYFREILERDQTGHVVMFTGDVPFLREKLKSRMDRNLGEEWMRRVIQLPAQTVSQYYRYLSCSTLILHSPVYTGEITSVDGFLHGIPGVTQTGDLLIQRYTTGFYDAAGIHGPAVHRRSEYIDQAVKTGTNPEYRQEISRGIYTYRKLFFNNQKTVHEWERFLNDVVGV